MFNTSGSGRGKYFCEDHQCHWGTSLGDAISNYFSQKTIDYMGELKRANARLSRNPDARPLIGYRAEKIIHAGKKMLHHYSSNDPLEFIKDRDIDWKARNCMAFLYRHGYVGDKK